MGTEYLKIKKNKINPELVLKNERAQYLAEKISSESKSQAEQLSFRTKPNG